MAPRMVMHPFRPELDGQDLSAFRDPTGFSLFIAFADMVRRQGSGVVPYLWPKPGAGQAAAEPVQKLSFVQGFAPWGWVIGSGVYVDDLRASQRSALIAMGTEAGIAALIVGLLAWLMARSIVGPLRDVTHATEAMAAGDLTTPVAGADRGDEVGVLGRALEAFRAQGLEKRRLEVTAQAERRSRDMRQAAMERQTQDFGTSIAGVMQVLGDSAGSMRVAADNLAQSMRRTSSGAATTAAGARESVNNLATIAAATEELTASVSEISRQVSEAARLAQDADRRARATDSTVRSLTSAAGEIGSVVRVISDIAQQTNLLALNATIEAARAGEAGKGFAVVAGEVKALAAQTAKATEQIGQQIAAMQNATGGAVEAVQAVGLAISRVSEVANTIAAATEEQGAVTREIAASVGAVAQQNQAASGAMQEVSSAVEAADETSRIVLASAGEVARVSSALRGEVDAFITAMRAEESERRRYERIDGGSAEAMVSVDGSPPVIAVLQDISLGGAALRCTLVPPVGTEVAIVLRGSQGPLAARIVRASEGSLAVTFRQDPATLRRIDAVLLAIGTAGSSRTAA